MIKFGSEFGFLDSDNESGDEEEEGGDDDSSEISVLALNARLREACRKSGAADPLWSHTISLGVTTSGAASLLTGHGSLRAGLQRKSLPSLTASPRASLVVTSSLAASPHARLPAASLTPSQHASLSTLRPSSRLLRDITNTMTTSSSSSSTSTLASIAHSHTPTASMVQKNPFSQNPVESETRMTMQENSISTSTQNAKINLKSQNSTSSIT